MQDVTRDNFGMLIAYVLPGFIALWGVSAFSQTVRTWLGSSSTESPTVGGFLYLTVAAVAAGMLISTVRWLAVDRVHHLTGLTAPKWDFGLLGDRLAAFELLVASHYVFYQWSANSLVAVAFTFSAYELTRPVYGPADGLLALGCVVVELILWLGSRDALRKYYERSYALLNGGAETVVSATPPFSS